MTPALFNVERSLAGARWVSPPVDAGAAQAIMRAHGVPEVIARLLAARGVAPGAVDSFLAPTLRRDFPDPFTLAGMAEAADLMAESVIAGQAIALFGDFDVDGATSSALLCRFLRSLGVEAPVYIPDRLSEGYGPNAKALRTLRAQGADLVVLMDCGTTAVQALQAGKDAGLALIVLDHHDASGPLAPADVIVNPKRADDASGLEMLAAVGVTLLFCVAVNAQLRRRGFYGGRAEPPLRDWLDLVALGTVCDMVPLKGPNRLLVRSGLERMARTTNPGLKALMEVSGLSEAPTVRDLGFALGPRINAGGRVHESDLGAHLLATDDAGQALDIAHALNDCNAKRRSLQTAMEKEAAAKVRALGLDGDPVIVVEDEGWHPGLAGLVAGRLKDRYARPACVVTYAKNGEGIVEGRGSARSVPGVHIARALAAAVEAGVLIKGGGHAAAGGFTLDPTKVSDLRDFLCACAQENVAEEGGPEETTIAGALSVRGAGPDLVALVHDRIGPFGQGHAEPLFALGNVRVWAADVVGSGHVRVQVADAEGGPRMKAIAFRAEDTALGQALLTAGSRPMHIAGALARNAWGGRVTAEMHIADAAFAGQA
ncbi:MAG TPA: single-stranded-DNA-specific exonuclease RecJ [Rhodospirillaceae bacterium]|nr:single-stranded-DNA-specific exonuclease RecJ [Alphaproteobacteria bacterium]HBH25809.1 single-stranded-DNA-specific exonuclease RecJ [Rhodospirillaceae bacterium]